MQICFADYPFDVDGYDGVEFWLCKNKASVNGFIVDEAPNAVIDLTRDLDEIWKRLKQTSCRYRIKRAERDGVVVEISDNYEEFQKIYRRFVHRKKGLNNPLRVETMKLDAVNKHGTLFIARHEGNILVTNIYLEDKDNIRLWYSASKRLDANPTQAILIGNANRMIYWEAIKYAKRKGIKEFDMGGLWSEEDASKDKFKHNINEFKLSFGGNPITCYNYFKAYSNLYKTAFNFYRQIFH